MESPVLIEFAGKHRISYLIRWLIRHGQRSSRLKMSVRKSTENHRKNIINKTIL